MAKVRKKITRRDIMLAGEAIKRLALHGEGEIRQRAAAALLAFNNKSLGADDVRFFAHHQLTYIAKTA